MKSTAEQLSSAPEESIADNDRRKGRRRSKTIALKRLTREEIRQGIELVDYVGATRPQNRSECIDGRLLLASTTCISM